VQASRAMFTSASLRLSALECSWMPSTGTQFGHSPTSSIASCGDAGFRASRGLLSQS